MHVHQMQELYSFIIKTQVRVLFDTDLHGVVWHLKLMRPSDRMRSKSADSVGISAEEPL